MDSSPAPESSVFSSAQFSQVVFHNLSDSYPTDSGLLCKYSIHDGLEYSDHDRIGIFQVGWQSLDEAFFFQKAPKPTNAVIFNVEDLPKDDKMYQLCYITKDEMVAGASIPFFFRSPLENELMAVEDSDNDFVTVNSNFAVVQSVNTELTKQNEKLKEDLERVRKALSDAMTKELPVDKSKVEQECRETEARIRVKEKEFAAKNRELEEYLDRMTGKLIESAAKKAEAEAEGANLEHDSQSKVLREALKKKFTAELGKIQKELDTSFLEAENRAANTFAKALGVDLEPIMKPWPPVLQENAGAEDILLHYEGLKRWVEETFQAQQMRFRSSLEMSAPPNVCPIDENRYTDVTITCTLGSDLYFCQPTSSVSETVRLHACLQKEGAGAQPLIIPLDNEVCLANHDGEWYRAIILEIKSLSARVQLMDYGDVIEVPIETLRKISGGLIKAPVYCFKLRLVSNTMPKDYLNRPPYARLIVRPLRFCNVINGWIVAVPDDPLHIFSVIDAERSQPAPKPSVEAGSHDLGPNDQDGYADITITHVVASNVYFGRPTMFNEGAVRLHKRLQKEGSSAESVGEQLPVPDVGGLCLLKHEEEWYRAKILSLVSAAARVQLIDWGDVVDTWLHNLKQISAESKAAPLYCFKLKLADTTPEKYLNRSVHQRLIVKTLRFCEEENAWIVAVKEDPLAVPNADTRSRSVMNPSLKDDECFGFPGRRMGASRKRIQLSHRMRLLHHLTDRDDEEKSYVTVNSAIMRVGQDKESNKSQCASSSSSQQSNDETVAQLKKEIQGLQAYIAELEATTTKKYTNETRPQPTLTNEQVDHIVHTLSDELAKVELENKELKETVDELKKQVSESCSKSEANELSSVSSDGTEDIVHVLSDELTRVESENKSLKETVEGLQKEMKIEDQPESSKNEMSGTRHLSSDELLRLKMEEMMFANLPEDGSAFKRSESVKKDDDIDQFMRDEWSRVNDWFDTMEGKSKDKVSEPRLQNVSSSNSEDISAGSASDRVRSDPQVIRTGNESTARVELENQVSEEERKSTIGKIDCPFDHVRNELNRAAMSLISQVENGILAGKEPKNVPNKVNTGAQFLPHLEVCDEYRNLKRKAAYLFTNFSESLQKVDTNPYKIPEVFKDSAQDYLENLPQVSWRTRSLISGFSHAVTSLNVILGQPVVEDTTFKMQMETLSSFRSFSVEFTNNHSRVVLQLKASVFPEYAFILNSLDENWGPGEKHQFLLEPSSVYDFRFVIKRDHIELQVSETLSKRNVTIKYRHRMPPSEIRYIHISGDVIVCGASVVEAENACCQEMKERLHTAFVEYTNLSYRMAVVKNILKEKTKKSKKQKKRRRTMPAEVGKAFNNIEFIVLV